MANEKTSGGGWKESEHPRKADGEFTIEGSDTGNADEEDQYADTDFYSGRPLRNQRERQNVEESSNEARAGGTRQSKQLSVPEGEDLRTKILADVDGKMTVDEIVHDPVIQDAQMKYYVSKADWTSNINNPKRDQIRRAAAEEMLQRGSISGKDEFNGKVQKGFRAEIVIGVPAGGKSSVIVDKVSKNTGSKVLDSDEIKKLLPEFNGGNGAGKVHEESSNILTDMVIPEFGKGGRNTGENIVIPIVGKNPKHAVEYLEMLKGAGYEVHLSLNDVSPLNSVKRATTRYIETGRFLDPEYIQGVGDLPQKAYEQLKTQGGFDTYTKYDNNVPFGQPAKKIERTDGKGNKIKWEEWQ